MRNLFVVSAVGIVAAASVGIGVARAQEAEPIAVDYEAPATCPSGSAFFDEIARRTNVARAARPGEAARVMHVVVTARSDRHAGRLWIDDGSAREVEGATCDEVVRALGLIGALAVDPHASLAPNDAADAAAPVIAADAAAPVVVDRPDAGAAPVSERPPRAHESDAPPVAIRFGVGAQVAVEAVAGAALSGRLFGDLELGFRSEVFVPSIRLDVSESLVDERESAGLGAALRFTTAGADLCPLRFAFSSAIAVRPCAGLDVGVISASSRGASAPETRSRPWVAVPLRGRLVVSPVRFLDLEAEGGVTVPLVRESFFFEPNLPVYEAPSVAGVVRAGVAVRFP